MIDKKKLAIILSAIGVCTIALIVAIIWAVTTLAGNNTPTQPSTSPTTHTEPATPTPTPTETSDGPSTEVPPLEGELQQKAENAAARAATWGGRSERSALESKYKSAGFSDALAKSYESIWAIIYADPAVEVNGSGEPKAETFASVVSSEVRNIRSNEGDRLYTVAVMVHYDAQWTDRNGRVHLGGVQSKSQGEAIWGVTISEKTGEVVEISDPPATSLVHPETD